MERLHPGSPAAIRRVMHEPPHLMWEDVDELERAIEKGKLPVHQEAGNHYARVKRKRQRKGLPLDENDLWIAATALALGAVLISRDSDLQQIDGLTVEDWTA